MSSDFPRVALKTRTLKASDVSCEPAEFRYASGQTFFFKTFRSLWGFRIVKYHIGAIYGATRER
jgi:hypothetical protein